MQMKTPARRSPTGISVYLLPGVNSPTIPDIKEAPGNHCGSGTDSPNGIRRILSYCEIRRPSSFINSAELYEPPSGAGRSEEHTSELQSLAYLVCRLLLEKKKNKKYNQS